MAKEANHEPGESGEHPDHFLREWREFMGWSQEELGEMAHVHYSTIGRIETGKRKLKTRFLRQLAGIFKVPASAIMEINPATDEGAQTAELLLAWSDLAPTQRDDILKMVRALSPRYSKPQAG